MPRRRIAPLTLFALTAARCVVGVVATLLLERPAAAQPAPAAELPAEIRTALARPVTPAATAMLVAHTSAPEVVERLRQALRDPSADVRAVAARIAFTIGHQGLLPALTSALSREAEAGAATEMARAVALIAGPAGDDLVFSAMTRAGRGVGEAWLGVTSRTRPGDVVARLPALGAAADDVLVALVASSPDDVIRAFTGLSTTTPSLEPAYLGLISRLDRGTAPVLWPLLALGLQGTPEMRQAVARLLLHRELAGGPLAPEALAALADLRARSDGRERSLPRHRLRAHPPPTHARRGPAAARRGDRGARTPSGSRPTTGATPGCRASTRKKRRACATA